MRKLATVRRIKNIQPIAGADNIELAHVDGWQSVVKKGEYKVGDIAIYCEVDSFIPNSLAPFLTKAGSKPKEFGGIRGERLRTMKLRGALSQGLLLPAMGTFPEGTDMTEALGIQKWEAPIPAQLSGQVRGAFPTLVPKTDQERCQNLVDEIRASHGKQFEVTEKLDGSSCTMFLDASGDFHVCSRNLDLQKDNNNSFWRAANNLAIEHRMVTNNLFGYAIQGELVGPGIQGNPYGLSTIDFYVFDVYDTRSGDYLKPDTRRSLIKTLGLNHVPVVIAAWTLDCEVDDLLKTADGVSLLNRNSMREGFVYKSVSGGMTFKVISNKFLLSER